jgi:hypothetical protein
MVVVGLNFTQPSAQWPVDIDRVVPPQWPTFSAKKPVVGVWTLPHIDWLATHSIVFSIQGAPRGSAVFGGSASLNNNEIFL